MAPRRRFRGQARYYRALSAEIDDALPDPTEWFDLWHYHADWDGYGNLSARHRSAHLRAHAAFFRRAAEALAVRTEPFQLWLYLSASDAGTDAVYIHTSNPNGTRFPVHVMVQDWGRSDIASYLQSEFDLPPLRVGRDAHGNVLAYAPGIGWSLDENSAE